MRADSAEWSLATCERRIGFHVSIAGGLHLAIPRALARGCCTFQIFCGSPRSWAFHSHTEEEIQRFAQARAEAGLWPLFVHASYLINPCSADPQTLRRSIALLGAELELSARLGADFYVLHPGSHKGRPAAWGVQQAGQSIAAALARSAAAPAILLENTASLHGPGGDFSSLRGLIELILSRAPGAQVGLALDSCHAFVAGYDFRCPGQVERLAEDIQQTVGLGRLHLMHVNDARDEPGSRRDRHYHIGRGTIGRQGLRRLLTYPAFARLPMILETPWGSTAVDRRNLQAALALMKRAPARCAGT